MIPDRCHGFKVYPINSFYAIGWQDWAHFFEAQYASETMQNTKDSIAVHVWNKHSKNKLIKVGSKVAYGLLAEKYCPRVYRSCGEYF